MDDISAIKSRLTIEDLVGRYCQLQKKGRNLVCLCPFHNDKKPSFLVSPDKGIGYCFACQTGGDIFSFYQKIENVDFQQAIKDLAEMAGVTLSEKVVTSSAPKKGEKDRARECLQAACDLYIEKFSASSGAQMYLQKRCIPAEQIEQFHIGVAPDSFSATYEHLLKKGFSRSEILAAGLGIQKELTDERIYDRFRNRLMFPIYDVQGGIVGFGGRTLGQDDAKYVNTSDSVLYHKSQVLFALNIAREPMRKLKCAYLVEGYFDVLACHQVGVTNTVATCGTALTTEHVQILKRMVDRVVLCMDQDRAGQEAMERSFPLLVQAGLSVELVTLPGKDPADVLVADAAQLKDLLAHPVPYLDAVLHSISRLNLSDAQVRKESLRRVLNLIAVLPSAVERSTELEKAAIVFRQTKSDLENDLVHLITRPSPTNKTVTAANATPSASQFSSIEIVLGMLLLYPNLRYLIKELIEPPGDFTRALHIAMTQAAPGTSLEQLPLQAVDRERASVLQLFCEEHGFAEWSEALAVRELRRNCQAANRDLLRAKQLDITKRLLIAKQEGKFAEEAQLQTEFQQVLKLLKSIV